MNARQQLVERLLMGGLVVGIPIHICKAPEYGCIAQFLGLPEVFFAVFALRRPVKFGEFLAGQGFVLFFHTAQLLFKGGLVGDLRHVRMRRGVVPDDMPFLGHTFDKVGRGSM